MIDRKKIIISTIIILCMSVFFATAVSAEINTSSIDMNTQLNAFGSQIGTSTETASDPRIIVARAIRVFLSVMSVVAVSYVIYGGYLYMTSGGSDERVGKARKIILYGALGLAVMLTSFSLTSLVYKSVYGSINPWNGTKIYTQKNNYKYNHDPKGGEMVPDEYDVDWNELLE